MQDNAPIHSAKIIRKWLTENSIATIKWPLYLPNLNPIEYMWAKLKERLYELDHDIQYFQGSEDELFDRFSTLIKRAWEDLGQDYFRRLILSMHDRVEAVIAAQGWYTRY